MMIGQSELIIGIDPSMTSTGISDGVRHKLIKSVPGPADADSLRDNYNRLTFIMHEIRKFVLEVGGDERIVSIFIEEHMRSAHTANVAHLFEMGMYFTRLLQLTQSNLWTLTTVSIPVLKKYVSGKGNTPKAAMQLAAFKKWKVEFEDDRGLDKLHAYALYQLGWHVRFAGFELTATARRGKGTTARATARRKTKRTEEPVQ
jgi:hypothetical protein